MSLNPPAPGTRVLNWALTLGGSVCVVIGLVILVKSPQPPSPRSFIFLVSVFASTMGIGNLLEFSHPELSSRLKFTGKVFAGLALFSLSWTLSHR